MSDATCLIHCRANILRCISINNFCVGDQCKTWVILKRNPCFLDVWNPVKKGPNVSSMFMFVIIIRQQKVTNLFYSFHAFCNFDTIFSETACAMAALKSHHLAGRITPHDVIRSPEPCSWPYLWVMWKGPSLDVWVIKPIRSMYG